MSAEIQRLLTRLGSATALVSGIAWFAQKGIYNVDGGERAVIWNRFAGGIQDEVKGEGTHFLIPFVSYPTIFDVRLRPLVIQTRNAGTKDLQQVQISIRVLSRPDEKYLPFIIQRLGINWQESIIGSIGTEVLNSAVSQFDADQLLSQRKEVARQIMENLSERCGEFHIKVEDVSITHLIYSEEFTKAIEAKAVAQQEAERSKFVVMKAEQEKEAAIILAEGESQAAMLISNALASAGTGAIEVKRIDAAKEIAAALSSSRNVAYMPSGVSMLMTPPRAAAAQMS